MSADWNKPATTDSYANFLQYLKDRDNSLALGMDSALISDTNVPTSSIRWNSTNSNWERWSGSAWSALTSAYGISITGAAPWANISGKPTTLSGYGITDAAGIAQVHYVGTTAIAANRTSASMALTGITSIDGTAVNLSGTPTLPNGTSVTTQAQSDSSTKAASTAFANGVPAQQLGLSKHFQSSATTFAFNNQYDFAHGLSTRPLLVFVGLQCVTAEIGWAIGDELSLPSYDSSTNTTTYGSDGTNVRISFGSGITINNKASNARSAITAANWKVVVRAWA